MGCLNFELPLFGAGDVNWIVRGVVLDWELVSWCTSEVPEVAPFTSGELVVGVYPVDAGDSLAGTFDALGAALYPFAPLIIAKEEQPSTNWPKGSGDAFEVALLLVVQEQLSIDWWGNRGHDKS